MRELTDFYLGQRFLVLLLACFLFGFLSRAQSQVNEEVVLYSADGTGLLITEDELPPLEEDELPSLREPAEDWEVGDVSFGGEDRDVVVLPELSGSVGDLEVVNNITLGDFIVDERQLLYKTQVVTAEFLDAPAVEVLRGLAEAADINYVLPKVKSDKISIKLRMPAFKALELIASEVGMEVVKEKDLWFIKEVHEGNLVARVYALENIHLGVTSGGGTAGGEDDRSFGSGSDSDLGDEDDDDDDDDDDDTTTSTTGTSTSGTSTASTSRRETVLEDVEERLEEGSDVIDTIREILGIPLQHLKSDTGEEEEVREETDEDEPNHSFISYNAEANTLYVIATEKQHEWVARYIETVDKAVSNIAIDALFIETELNPNEALGVNWEPVAAGYTFSAGLETDATGSISFKTLDDPILPSGVNFLGDPLSATVRAWIEEDKAKVARYPRVITANNKLVKIQTTTNVPILTETSTTGLAGQGGVSDTTQTDFVAGTQQIGTIIHLVPQQINDELVLLRVGIEISSEDQDTAGETLTGRISTSSTVYEGDMKVPSGKTLVIGGLEVIAETSNIRRVPWLSEIPLFGFLFKDKEKDFRRTNITLLITPTILGDADAKTLLPSEFRDTRDQRIMEEVDAVETLAVENETIYRNR